MLRIDGEARKLFEEIRQTEEERNFTMVVLEEVTKLITKGFAKLGMDVKVDMFGSTSSDLALRGSSDLDLCITLPPDEAARDPPNFNLLYEAIVRYIRHDPASKSDLVTIEKELAFVATFGEILNMVVVSRTDPANKRDVGIVMNHSVNIPVRDLIKTYSHLDERCKILACLLKQWSKVSFSKNNRMLVSHAIVLMTISYLQHEGVLPRL
jgi:DNA polymerase sigma